MSHSDAASPCSADRAGRCFADARRCADRRRAARRQRQLRSGASRARSGTEPGGRTTRDAYSRSRARIRLAGYFWVRHGLHAAANNAQAGTFDQNVGVPAGPIRASARAYRRDLGDYFAEARLELVGLDNEFTSSQYEPHILDAFVRVGQQRWDVQVGRFLDVGALLPREGHRAATRRRRTARAAGRRCTGSTTGSAGTGRGGPGSRSTSTPRRVREARARGGVRAGEQPEQRRAPPDAGAPHAGLPPRGRLRAVRPGAAGHPTVKIEQTVNGLRGAAPVHAPRDDRGRLRFKRDGGHDYESRRRHGRTASTGSPSATFVESDFWNNVDRRSGTTSRPTDNSLGEAASPPGVRLVPVPAAREGPHAEGASPASRAPSARTSRSASAPASRTTSSRSACASPTSSSEPRADRPPACAPDGPARRDAPRRVPRRTSGSPTMTAEATTMEIRRAAVGRDRAAGLRSRSRVRAEDGRRRGRDRPDLDRGARADRGRR